MTASLHLFWPFLLVLVAGCSETRTIQHADFSTADSAFHDLGLPPDASDVCAFEEVGGLQYLCRLYRFHTSRGRLDGAVDEIVKQSELQMSKEIHYSYETQPISPAVYTWPSWAKERLNWWTPDSITNGYFKGANQAYGLTIWVDRDRELIFVHQTD